MKKIRKIKKLFIDELETRKSTSPLFVQTMSAGEAGMNAKEQAGGSSSKENLTNGQKAKEELIAKKNDEAAKITPVKPPECIAMYAVKMPPDRVTTAAEGEETITPKPKPIIAPLPTKYAPPDPKPLYAVPDPKPRPLYAVPDPKPTTLAEGEEGVAPKPKPVIAQPLYAPPKPIIAKYAPPQPTNKLAEGGPVPKPVIAKYAPPPPTKYAPPHPPKPIPILAYPKPKPKPTTAALGEEGMLSKPGRILGSIIKRILEIKKEEEE